MDEYLSEQEQWDRFKQWMKQNVPWLIGGVAIAALGLAGWRWWQGHNESDYLAAMKLYEQVVQSYSKKDTDGALKSVDQLIKEYPGTGYADLAGLAAARIQMEKQQHAQAVERLQQVVQSTKDEELALVARLRIARIQIDQSKPDEALATLAAAKETGAFAPRFAEARGDALYAKGDNAGALKAYREAQATGSAALDNELLSLKINELSRS